MTQPGARPSPNGVEGAGDYPSEWESDVVLRDGGTVHLRPIRADDADGIREFHSKLSPESIYFRFFSPLTKLSPAMLERFTQVDYRERFAIVAELGDDIIAVGRYEGLPSHAGVGEAEVAFLVADEHQGRGLATVLLEFLTAAARRSGIGRFVADTLPENVRMLRVFKEAGFGRQQTFEDGVIRVSFDIDPTHESVSLAFERERQATARSVRRLLEPRSIAVVGASRRRGSMGHTIVRALVEGGFQGAVYPVNPNALHVLSIPCYPSIMDLPERVDLAVIIVPADAVRSVVAQCARRHVGGLIIVSAGFAEHDDEGAAAERELVLYARRNGMRIIGPNAMGVVNTDRSVALNATFSHMVPSGNVGMVAQSGGLGVAILDEFDRRGLGVSSFVSAGNKADVSGNDLLQYWHSDPATSVICMYIESFGNPRTFSRVARRISERKPIVAVKSARSHAGLIAATRKGTQIQDDSMVDALFRRTGVIRTDTMEELFDVAQVLASQPIPAGGRVAVVGNSGGPGVLAADAATRAGLSLAEFAPATVEVLRRDLGQDAARRNPVDLSPDAQPEAFRLGVEAALADPGVDSVIALYTSPTGAPIPVVGDALRRACESAQDKPLVACVLGTRGLLKPTQGEGIAIPSFAFPEAAIRALGYVTAYAAWRNRDKGRIPQLSGLDRPQAKRLIESALATGAPPPAHPATGSTTVAEAHQEDEPAIVVSEADTAAILASYGIRVTGSPPGEVIPVTVELIQDPLFGATISAAPSGTRSAELHVRAVPLRDTEAAELSAEILTEETPEVATALRDLLSRVSAISDDLPEVTELRLDALQVLGGTIAVGEAHLEVSRWRPHPERALRRLR